MESISYKYSPEFAVSLSVSSDNDPGPLYLAAYNEESATLQRLSGVNPNNCFKLIDWPSPQDTPMLPYLGAINAGEYYVSRSDHDIKNHFHQIRDLHPEVVSLSVAYSGYGLDRLVHRDYEIASNVVQNFDLGLFQYGVNIGTISQMLAAVSEKRLDAGSLVRESKVLGALQHRHSERMTQSALMLVKQA